MSEEKGGVKWDEQNIKETFHPPDKDYGHMKINEPNTPYEPPMKEGDGDDDDELPELSLGDAVKGSSIPKEGGGDEFGDEKSDKVQEEQRKHRAFEQKRKEHYDMRAAMLRARKLIEEEEGAE